MFSKKSPSLEIRTFKKLSTNAEKYVIKLLFSSLVERNVNIESVIFANEAMKKQKQTNSTSPVFYLNCLLAIFVVIIGVVYQFILKQPDSDTLDGSSTLNSKTDASFDDIPPFPLFTAEELMQYDGESEFLHGTYDPGDLLHLDFLSSSDKPQLYLAIMGDIFDVTRGAKVSYFVNFSHIIDSDPDSFTALWARSIIQRVYRP